MSEPIWEGVYNSFAEVPVQGAGFDGGTWVENSLARMRAARGAAGLERLVPGATKIREGHLPVVAALALVGRPEVSVLDFGGGIGFAYYNVAGGLPAGSALDFHVVEVAPVCAAGREFFAGVPGVHFHERLEDASGPFDVVHIGSTLQYMEDWRGALADLRARAGRFLAFTDLSAGDIPTYASAQNYYGSKIARWFFNLREILDDMEQGGFTLVHRSLYLATIRGQEGPLPQDNLPETHRLDHTCNLLFARGGQP